MIEEVRRTGMSMSALRASDSFIETFTPIAKPQICVVSSGHGNYVGKPRV